MATLKETMDRVARHCSLTPPSDWITTTNASYVEIKDFLEETVDELLERVDWPSPIGKTSDITGVGTPSSSGNYSTHSLATDFKRLQRGGYSVWEETNTRRIASPVSQDGQWQYLDAVGSAGAYRFYRVQGDEDAGFTIDLFRALTANDTVKVNYISKNWLRLVADSTLSATWADANDTLLLPRRLVELGCVWRFRARKGMGYQDVYAQYEIELTRRANDARTSRSVNMGSAADGGHPMRVPVPDFIPSS